MINIATDGSARSGEGGAWAWVSEDGTARMGRHETSNPAYAELSAVKSALECNYDRPIRVIFDFGALLGTLKGRKGNSPSVAPLVEYINMLLSLREHEIEWVQVPGHSGHTLNERADHLAGLALNRFDVGVQSKTECYRSLAARYTSLERGKKHYARLHSAEHFLQSA